MGVPIQGRWSGPHASSAQHLSEPDLKQAAVIEAIFLYNTAVRDEMLLRPKLPLNGNYKPLECLYPDAAK
jgi:carboxypeptidase Q